MSEPANTPAKPIPEKRRVGFWRWLWRIAAGTFAVVVVLLALFIGLFRVVVPLLPDFQQRIEAAATRAIGYPLSVESIDARWRLRGPELVFEDVTLRTGDEQRDWFKARRLRVAIDALALLKGGELRPLSFTLTGSELSARRDASGNWFVQGVPLDSLRIEQQGGQPWGIADGEFGLENLRVLVEDELKDRTIDIPDLDLAVYVDNSLLSASGDFELASRGPRVEFSVDADGRSDAPDEIAWAAFVTGNNIDWSRLDAMLPAPPKWSAATPVDLALWLRAVGKNPREANLTIDARNLIVAGDDTPVGRLAGRFKWSGNAEQWRLSAENFVLGDARAAASGTLTVEVEPLTDQADAASHAPPSGSTDAAAVSDIVVGTDTERESMTTADGEVAAQASSSDAPAAVAAPVPADSGAAQPAPVSTRPVNRRVRIAATELDLDSLTRVANPVNEQVAAWIEARKPSGRVRDLNGFVDLIDQQVSDFALEASVDKLGLRASDTEPGFSGLDAVVSGDRTAGSLTVANLDEITLPGILREPIAIERAAASLHWSTADQRRELQFDAFTVQTADLAVSSDKLAFHQPSADAAWVADMALNVDRLTLARAYRYFPINRFRGRLLTWLDNALTAGTGSDGRFVMQGPVNRFPYANPQDGLFEASIRLNDATLHYANNWPDATELNAVLNFERNSLRGAVDSARLLTLPISGAQASIEDLKKAVVFVEGGVNAELDAMRAFLDATPVVKNWGRGWEDSQFYGRGNAQLTLTVPTKERQNTQFDVALQVADAQFQFRDWRHTLTGLNGELRASRQGVRATGVRGVFLEEPVTLEIEPSSVSGYTSEVSVRGTARPSSLARNLNESLADHLSGAADWSATVLLPRSGESAPLQARVRSPLQGLAITLPAPLAKPAAETRFTDALLTVVDDSEFTLSADYGDQTSMLARVRRQPDGFWHVPAGEIRFGGGRAVLPDIDEVRAMGTVEQLDLSEIIEFADSYAPERRWLELTLAELSVTDLRALEQRFGATSLRMVRDSRRHALEFVGDRISGNLLVPHDITPESPIIGQLETLQWSKTGSQEPVDPRDAPSLRAVVDSFRYEDRDMGALVVHLEARSNLVAVREFTTTAPDFSTRTTGSWAFGEGESTTFLVSEFKSANVKRTLQALGQAEFLEASDATARLEMSWPDGWTPDYLSTMEGELSVNIGPGKLVSVDPGAGRVFGLLSIGALPRRLNLDFRDVFDSGFGFDSITGDFVLREGNAVTENLALSGPAANVVILGRTGLIEKDYDQTAVVYANFGSSLPIAGVIAGGPAVGAALLVVSEIFKKPLQNMGKVSYSIKGSWDQPEVQRLGVARPASASEVAAVESAPEVAEPEPSPEEQPAQTQDDSPAPGPDPSLIAPPGDGP